MAPSFACVAAMSALLGLAACGSNNAPQPEAQDTAVPDAISGMQASPAQAEKGQRIGTPNKDRIVTLGVLNKRNNLTQDLVMKPGESRRVGNLVVKVCHVRKDHAMGAPRRRRCFCPGLCRGAANRSGEAGVAQDFFGLAVQELLLR